MTTNQTATGEVIFFEDVRRDDVPLVGGKNASLGEMVRELGGLGIAVPPGFATTAGAFRRFIEANGLASLIGDTMQRLDAGKITLHEAGNTIRKAIASGDWHEDTAQAITAAYRTLCNRTGRPALSVAVRSSATAEDLPDASFAGQQETFLNVSGEEDVLKACRNCYASLFTDRAISYRNAKGFDHLDVALSVGVQQMVRSDIGGSGVMFSIDTESGWDKVVLINAAWGLGENVVQGAVTPDEYQVYKPFLDDPALRPIIERKLGSKEIKMIYADKSTPRPVRNVPTSRAERAAFVLSDDEVLDLARQATVIERHYGMPMDMEWARDGETHKLYIVQARPETVQSTLHGAALRSYSIGKHGPELISGLSVGEQIATGAVCLIEDVADIDRFVDGAILVTSNTDPDWVPVMKRASAIVTDHGGRTSHAAIVSRELGVPAIVGCGNATHLLHDLQEVTVCCAEGDVGHVYEGIAEYQVEDLDLDHVPQTRTKVMLNLANPATAARWWRLPADGVGLARMEFVISNAIRIHPRALTDFDRLKDDAARAEIADLTAGYDDKREYFVDRLSRGLSRIAAVCHPNPMILRLSDFKTNEYADLLGGREFEPEEENPMIGWRGASRYYDPGYSDGFRLECQAIHRLREEMGFRNVKVMVPFCRTPEEADKVLSVMQAEGLERGQNDLELYVMCEIPSNVIMAEEFAKRFDGFSIGSNDLTQLTLGIDRDSDRLSGLFNERDPAVVWMIRTAIEKAHAADRKIGLCGQAPSNYPDFARTLVAAGIDSISVTPDSFLAVKQHVAEAESP
ncbi:phosphoenolpyruvate synthase [Sagittula salina]|uniref:Phosphoenolpyruvate synthase n=1 Tax=Sagittula salina TaxID=2820268 RepID=A0A940MMB1_9RHOB|nr:phosphoenolpyruvate synthase [Sagittula salina]MBP0482173.1 phosphoenolpyruvate synthase [Sagittula salina]